MKSISEYISEALSEGTRINIIINNIMDDLWESYLPEDSDNENDNHSKIIDLSDKIAQYCINAKNDQSVDKEDIKDTVELFIDLIEKHCLKYLQREDDLNELKEIFEIY